MSVFSRPLALRSVPDGLNGALIALVLFGVALRVYAMVVHSTVVVDYYTGDASRYIRAYDPGMFEDPWQPAGYALFLAAIRSVTDELAATVALQHLLGVVTALLLYATGRRAGLGPRMSLLAPAVVLISADQIFLEHAFLMESLWMALLAAGLYAAVRGTQTSVPWLALAGILLGLSIIVRNVGVLLPLLVAGCVLWMRADDLRSGLMRAAAVVTPAAAVVGAYLMISTSVGPYSGMGEMSGWSLYQRVAQFADCREFSPPRGTERLCEERPTEERPGPFYYYWSPDAPARTAFPAMSPRESELVGNFARAAILHQPLDYARTVVKDVVRYLDPQFGFDRDLSGSPPETMTFRQGWASAEDAARFADRVRRRYSGLDPTPDRGAGLLESYDRVFSLSGLTLLVLGILAVIAAVRGRGFERRVALLFTASAVLLFAMPAAVASYDARYAVPPAALLSLSAAIGLAAVVRGHDGQPEPNAAGPRLQAPANSMR